PLPRPCSSRGSRSPAAPPTVARVRPQSQTRSSALTCASTPTWRGCRAEPLVLAIAYSGQMLLLKAPIQHYAWGRTNGMAGLVGADASGEPDAELWVGTHPAAPTTLVDGSPLASVIA